MAKTITGIIIVVAFLLLAAGPSIIRKVSAETVLNLPSFNQLRDKLPQPLQDFMNSAGQISSGLAKKTANLDVNSLDPGALWQSLNNWFTQTTGGVSITGILKTVGNLIIWVLDAAAGIVRWGLSFLH